MRQRRDHPPYLRPVDPAVFEALRETAQVQLCEAKHCPAAELDDQELHDRMCRLYDAAGLSWTPNDDGWTWR